MAKFIIRAVQTNWVQIEIEADTEDEAMSIHEQDTIEDDYTRIHSTWEFQSIIECKENN